MPHASSTTSSAEMGDDDASSSQEKDVSQQEVGKRLRQSRARKHKQQRKNNISARPPAGLPVAQPHSSRRSARLHTVGLSSTAMMINPISGKKPPLGDGNTFFQPAPIMLCKHTFILCATQIAE
ncbi:hypothetical protein DUNSADRAFT_5573 [Dunaliella salina]|uniref:Uncharacterized protein n=1 Tax=Dunaliella salina TaxID=3046 RepID=A0ABQ7GQ10_DUNSA|nr:hypothetical protein DUNSADRAFT_5573 [Dunaliella salina]|eukprot:KAF5836698.1 hypothetical protein DUNSADRAFT_5573 [Dunaliella salina]